MLKAGTMFCQHWHHLTREHSKNSLVILSSTHTRSYNDTKTVCFGNHKSQCNWFLNGMFFYRWYAYMIKCIGLNCTMLYPYYTKEWDYLRLWTSGHFNNAKYLVHMEENYIRKDASSYIAIKNHHVQILLIFCCSNSEKKKMKLKHFQLI